MGKAVRRNRLRRRLRAIVRTTLAELPSCDCVIDFKPGIDEPDFAALCQDLAQVFQALRRKGCR